MILIFFNDAVFRFLIVRKVRSFERLFNFANENKSWGKPVFVVDVVQQFLNYLHATVLLIKILRCGLYLPNRGKTPSFRASFKFWEREQVARANRQIWIVVDVVQQLLNDPRATVLLVKIYQFRNKLHCHSFHVQNIQKNCITWVIRYANILTKFYSSNPMIFHKNLLHCFNIFIGCRRTRRAGVVFSAFCEELVQLIKRLFFAQSRSAKCHSQYLKCAGITKHPKARLTFIPIKNKLHMRSG